MAPIWQHRDTPNARLPDRTPPRRGNRLEPSRPEHLARSEAICSFVAVRPAGSDEGASPHPARQTTSPQPLRPTTVPQLSIVSAHTGPTPPPRLEGGLSVNRALGVSPLSQIGAPNRVRPRMVDGQTAYRADAKLSTGTESRPQHVSATRPPVRPGRNGAEGGRGAGSHDSQGSPSTMSGRPNPGSWARRSSLPAIPVRRPPCDRGSRLPNRPATTQTPS